MVCEKHLGNRREEFWSKGGNGLCTNIIDGLRELLIFQPKSNQINKEKKKLKQKMIKINWETSLSAQKKSRRIHETFSLVDVTH